SPTPGDLRAVAATPFQDYVIGPLRGALWWLLAAVAALLLVACANVSGLMLTRAAVRQREQAIRVALGATAAAIARLWLLESLVLATVGGALGLATARWMMSATAALAPADVPGLADVSLNHSVAGFTFVAIALTALLCGLGPVLHMPGRGFLRALNDT